jgi:hypothetical protein
MKVERDKEKAAAKANKPVEPKGEDGEEEGGEEELAEEEEEEELEPAADVETLRPYLDAASVLAVWSRAFEGATGEALVALSGHLLPAKPTTCALVRATALFLGTDESVMKDVFLEISWEKLRVVSTSGQH